MTREHEELCKRLDEPDRIGNWKDPQLAAAAIRELSGQVEQAALTSGVAHRLLEQENAALREQVDTLNYLRSLLTKRQYVEISDTEYLGVLGDKPGLVRIHVVNRDKPSLFVVGATLTEAVTELKRRLEQ